LLRFLGLSDPYFELARIARSAKADLFLDIGCHYGDALLRFLDAGISCPVVAFDPLEQNLKMARRNLRQFPMVRFEQLALSDQDGAAHFFVNRNRQTSSLLDNAPGNLESFRKDTEHLASLEVPVSRLDTWFAKQPEPQPQSILVKCDTQGAEAKVFQGGKMLLQKRVIAVYAEVMLGKMYQGQSDFSTLRNFLEVECGMMLRNIYPCFHDKKGQAVQMDALWIRPRQGVT
jgi:FkbM family methyltransferase